MSDVITLEARTREATGKGPARTLRREGRIPAILYGGADEPVKLDMIEKDVQLAMRKGRFFARVVELTIDGKKQKALPKSVQNHPVTDRPEHVDFLRIEEGRPVKVWVPVIFHGKDKSIGLKRGGALNVVRHEVELICPSNRIPNALEYDLTTCNIGESVHIRHIPLPEGVRPVIHDRDFTIATIVGRGKADDTAAEGAAA
jgi:large subunit ribosomal protein L25